MSKYSLLTLIKMVIWKFRSFLISKNIRLIRFPIDIRGKKHIDFGEKFTTGFGCRIEALGSRKSIFFGKNVQINDFVHITGSVSVKIGDNVLIASKVYISDTIHGNYSGQEEHSAPEIPPNERPLFYKPVIISENVWIGESVSILPGVTIGEGAVIGANSVVTKDIPSRSIAAGVPARVIKKYDSKIKKWIAI